MAGNPGHFYPWYIITPHLNAAHHLSTCLFDKCKHPCYHFSKHKKTIGNNAFPLECWEMTAWNLI